MDPKRKFRLFKQKEVKLLEDESQTIFEALGLTFVCTPEKYETTLRDAEGEASQGQDAGGGRRLGRQREREGRHRVPKSAGYDVR